MIDTYVTAVGNLVADPVARASSTGSGQFTSFRIASTPRRRDANGQWVNKATSYYGVTAFNSVGANAAASLRKGDAVIVWGRLRVNEWTSKDGVAMRSVEIDAVHIGADLTFGRTRFEKVVGAHWPTDERTDDPAVREAIEQDLARAADADPARTDEYIAEAG